MKLANKASSASSLHEHSATLQSRQLIMNHVHMCMVYIILLGFSTAACISATVYCIDSLHAFRHLLPACFHTSAVYACICCLSACMHAFLHLLYAFMLLTEASHLWCFSLLLQLLQRAFTEIPFIHQPVLTDTVLQYIIALHRGKSE